MQERRWRLRQRPFPHVIARSVFRAEVYRRMEAEFLAVLGRGLSEQPSTDMFSRNMPHSPGFAWNFPPDLSGALSLFYGRAWHDLLTGLFDVEATRDVNGALHHHPPHSPAGHIHRDMGVGWFSSQPRADGVNPMDLTRCGYTRGTSKVVGVVPRETVRAVTMVFFLANDGTALGAEGGTGLYDSEGDRVDRPARSIPPHDNTLLVFQNTPAAFHAFQGTRTKPRNSVILWLHRSKESAVACFGSEAIYRWR